MRCMGNQKEKRAKGKCTWFSLQENSSISEIEWNYIEWHDILSMWLRANLSCSIEEINCCLQKNY